jgi:hypothetical protein
MNRDFGATGVARQKIGDGRSGNGPSLTCFHFEPEFGKLLIYMLK